MRELFEIAHCNALFSGIEANEFSSMLSCVEGTLKDYGRGASLQAGDPVLWVGLVIRGSVQVLRQDSDGRHSLMAQLGPGAAVRRGLCLRWRAAQPCHGPGVPGVPDSPAQLPQNHFHLSSACPFHQKLIGNMLRFWRRKT